MSNSSRNWPDWLPHPLWIRRKCPRCNSMKFKQAELRSFDGLSGDVCIAPRSLHVLLADDTTGLRCTPRLQIFKASEFMSWFGMNLLF